MKKNRKSTKHKSLKKKPGDQNINQWLDNRIHLLNSGFAKKQFNNMYINTNYEKDL